jgi:hypothetical protein
MFRWYSNAAKCFVYWADVDINQPLEESRWFTRGWTLQELIAPHSVEFFSADGVRIGDKKSLEQQISRITGVPTTALQGQPLDSFSVEQRMAWAKDEKLRRKKTKLTLFWVSSMSSSRQFMARAWSMHFTDSTKKSRDEQRDEQRQQQITVSLKVFRCFEATQSFCKNRFWSAMMCTLSLLKLSAAMGTFVSSCMASLA